MSMFDTQLPIKRLGIDQVAEFDHQLIDLTFDNLDY